MLKPSIKQGKSQGERVGAATGCGLVGREVKVLETRSRRADMEGIVYGAIGYLTSNTLLNNQGSGPWGPRLGISSERALNR
jgi:hypothetical protein